MMAQMGWLDVFTVVMLAANALSTVSAGVARTYPMLVLDWELESQMQLLITREGDLKPKSYTIIPLTADLGLNESQIDRGKIHLEGRLTLADPSTYATISGSDAIPYMSCDGTADDSFIDANRILNDLMSNDPQPQAILLYSQEGQSCGLSGQNLNFQRLLTMPDRHAAAELGNLTTSATGTIRASISGNFTSKSQEQDGQQTGNNSAVAMSILYSITGLITLLFLVIIATGAVRAHRYPERYGPRSGFGGRPRQSRAKGLARAVLETLPIVKFGDTQPAKPDPNIELPNDNVHREAPHQDFEHHLSTIPETTIDAADQLEAVTTRRTGMKTSTSATGEGLERTSNEVPGVDHDQRLGCSICTEDFTLGEDVRVLPCNHKFHPACVDPWLVNVSGTCPLCRLDLRPEHEDGMQISEENPEATNPGTEGIEAGDSPSSSRRRSRLFDLARLRHASVEERIEALRRIRTEEQEHGRSGSISEEGSRGRPRLADRLRDRITRGAQRTPEQAGPSSLGSVGTSQNRPSS